MKVRSVWIAGALALLVGAGSSPPVRQDARDSPPGEGVFCTMAIFGVIAEIGRRCYPDRLPEFQAELRQSLARLDAYVLANSDLTVEDLARFKADQSGADAPDAELCSSDFASVYTEPQAAETTGAVGLGSYIDELVARPGTPTWGTCV